MEADTNTLERSARTACSQHPRCDAPAGAYKDIQEARHVSYCSAYAALIAADAAGTGGAGTQHTLGKYFRLLPCCS